MQVGAYRVPRDAHAHRSLPKHRMHEHRMLVYLGTSVCVRTCFPKSASVTPRNACFACNVPCLLLHVHVFVRVWVCALKLYIDYDATSHFWAVECSDQVFFL